MKRVRPRVTVNLPELDRVLDQARQTPLSNPEYQKLKHTLHLLVGLLQPTARSTEKTSAVLADGSPPVPAASEATEKKAAPGHGRNGAAAFTGAQKVVIAHADLQSGQGCPACGKGKVSHQKEPN